MGHGGSEGFFAILSVFREIGRPLRQPSCKAFFLAAEKTAEEAEAPAVAKSAGTPVG
jgi:hypothetical protein